jgi:hypothetical protein
LYHTKSTHDILYHAHAVFPHCFDIFYHVEPPVRGAVSIEYVQGDKGSCPTDACAVIRNIIKQHITYNL